MANLEVLRSEGCDPRSFLWSRRTFTGLAAWGAILGALGVGVASFVRFMYPRVLYEPRTYARIGRPAEYAVGSVSDKWIKQYRFWLIRRTDGFVALSAKCR